ncbi:MAG: glycosyltransferase family 2 protein, partial [Arcobacter sp.]|nr:glycosyltransferase family 2 protein [Arcobacter sp.]
MPLFSVIIPLYNKENYIENTLQSVLDQTYKDFELIIVNDGSTDNSLEKTKNYLSSFVNHKIISQKNKGLSATRNKGVLEAKGEVIAFLDADDFWHPNFLEHIHNLFLEFPEASLFGTSYLLKYSEEVVLEAKNNIDRNLKNTMF